MTPKRLDELRHWQSLTKPMPTRRTVLPFHVSFSPDEVKMLRNGMVPTCMEDKWFGILHDEFLDFYRSWTGYHIYRLCLCQGEDGTLVADSLIVSRARRQYTNTDPVHDLEMLAVLIERLLAGEPA